MQYLGISIYIVRCMLREKNAICGLLLLRGGHNNLVDAARFFGRHIACVDRLAWLVGNEPLTILAVHMAAPRAIDSDGTEANDEEEAADGATDNIKMIANGRHAVPEAALRIGHVLRQREHLNDADKG